MKPTDEEPKIEPERLPAAEAFPDYESEAEAASVPTNWWSRFGSVKLALGFVVLVLIGLGLWVSPRLYDRFKEFRAMGFVATARQAEKAGDVGAALASYRQAFLIAPESAKVRRTVMTFSARQGDPAALQEMETVIAGGDATPAELLATAEGRLRTGDVRGAADLAYQLELSGLTGDLAFAKLKIDLRISAGTEPLPETLEKITAEIARRPAVEADELRLLAAELLLGLAQVSRNMGPANQARDFLLAIEGSDSQASLVGLRYLAQLDLAKLPVPGIGKVIARLKTHPLRDQNDALLAASVEIADLLTDRQVVIDRIKTAYRGAEKSERLAAARWLLQQKAQADALEFIGEKQALAESDFFLVYGDALSGLGRWSDLRELLEAHRVPGLDESIRHLFLLRVAMEMGDKARIETEWREINRYLRLADDKTVLYVARYAETIGAGTQAARIFQTLAGRPDAPVEALIGYLKYVPSNTSSRELLPIYERILALKPDFLEAQNDYAYLRLLLGQESEKILPEARARFAEAPTRTLAFLTTLALAEVRNGNATAASRLYDENNVELKGGTDAQRAVRARVLWDSGQKEIARTMLLGINRAALRPMERKLIEEIGR